MSTDHSGSGEPEELNKLNGQGSTNSPFKKSTLSADAPVFVPRFASQQQYNFQPQMSAGDPVSMSGGNTQMGYQYNQVGQMPQPNGRGVAPQDNGSPIETFRTAVVTLATKGNVEEYMKPIVDQLRNGVTDMAVINKMIDILYDQSITVPNYCYTGARICQYLSNELKNHPSFSNFRAMFLQKCKSAYDNREALLADPAALPTLCSLSMFIGELFLVLETEVDGQLQKLGFLRQAISSLLLTLLSRPDDDTVKCATQLLKLTGFEITKNSHLPGDFEEIYNIIRSLEKHPSLNRTSHCLINSVLSRLEYNWGVQAIS